MEIDFEERPCSRYIEIDDPPEDVPPCKCPVCGAYLSWKGLNPECHNCGTELIAYPDVDDETGEVLEVGKICPVGPIRKPDYANRRKVNKAVKDGRQKWKDWL